MPDFAFEHRCFLWLKVWDILIRSDECSLGNGGGNREEETWRPFPTDFTSSLGSGFSDGR